MVCISDLVNILIKNNWTAWDKVLKNKFSQDMVTQRNDGSAGYQKVLNGFKWYTVVSPTFKFRRRIVAKLTLNSKTTSIVNSSSATTRRE